MFATYDFININPTKWTTPQAVAGSWPVHPWNPKNNVNYGYAPDTILPEKTSKPRVDEFYHTIPALNHDPKVLKYQQAFVNKALKHSLGYDDVLYCVDNELRPHLPYQWSHYWANYMQLQLFLVPG